MLARKETVYAKCPKCGTSLVIMDGIRIVNCNDCNLNLEYNVETKEFEILGRNVEFASGKVAKSIKTVGDSTLGNTRHYFPYLLFGIFTLGIGFIIYMMKGLRDLEVHDTYGEVEKGAHPIVSQGETFLNFNEILKNRLYYSPYYMIPLFFITISYDLITAAEDKYSSLYHHLKDQPKETAPVKPLHSAIYVTALIILLLSIIASIPYVIVMAALSVIGFSPALIAIVAAFGTSLLVIILCGAIWQRAFNEHIKAMRKLGFR